MRWYCCGVEMPKFPSWAKRVEKLGLKPKGGVAFASGCPGFRTAIDGTANNKVSSNLEKQEEVQVGKTLSRLMTYRTPGFFRVGE